MGVVDDEATGRAFLDGEGGDLTSEACRRVPLVIIVSILMIEILLSIVNFFSFEHATSKSKVQVNSIF